MAYQYDFCVIEHNDDILEYEKCLYDAFVIRTNNPVSLENCTIVDDCRLVLNQGYDNLKIIGLKRDGQLKLALTLNKAVDRPLQLEKIGFSRKLFKPPYCEGFKFFIKPELNGPDFIFLYKKVFSFMVEMLNKEQISYVYSTCEPRLKRFYERIGFNILEERETGIGKRYLLELDVAKMEYELTLVK